MATLNPRKKYRDTYDGRVQTGAAWIKELKGIVEDDHADYGIQSSVEEYLELWTMQNGECDHHLEEA